jgi:hypothetical protein
MAHDATLFRKKFFAVNDQMRGGKLQADSGRATHPARPCQL